MIRSRLYSLEPKGIGTPFVESVISYITRLADKHRVTIHTLLNYELIPELNKELSCSISPKLFWVNDNLRKLLGGYKYSTAIIKVLEKLTLRNDLFYVNLANVIYNRKSIVIIRRRRAWCPECLKESEKSGYIYEQLLWTLQIVKCCPKHRIYLQHKCPRCDKSLPHSSWRGKNGYCNYCGDFLGQYKIKNEADETDVEVSIKIGIFLTKLKDLSINLCQITNGIRYIIDQKFNGNCTDFSNYLGLDRFTVYSWYGGVCIPRFQNVVLICNIFNLDIASFYNNHFILKDIQECEMIKNKDIFQTYKAKVNRKLTDEEKNLTRNILISYLNRDEEPISLNAITKQLDIDHKILRKYFTSECKAISLLYKNYRLNLKQKRAQILHDEIKNIIIDLNKQGLYPSFEKVMNFIRSRHCSYGGTDSVRIVWREVQKELGMYY